MSRMTTSRRELEELDRLEVLHTAAHTLCRVKKHIGLGAVGVAQHADAEAIHDEIAATEITERNGRRVGSDGRHVLHFRDRIVQKRWRLTGGEARLPEIIAIHILELADR